MANRSSISLIIMACLTACGPNKDKIVQEKVTERVSVYRAKKIAECREALLFEAGKTADSLLLAEAQAALRDSLARGRPVRPQKPAPLMPLDSGKIQPIFNRQR